MRLRLPWEKQKPAPVVNYQEKLAEENRLHVAKLAETILKTYSPDEVKPLNQTTDIQPRVRNQDAIKLSSLGQPINLEKHVVTYDPTGRISTPKQQDLDVNGLVGLLRAEVCDKAKHS